MVFCTLETGIFGLISEVQLIVAKMQIKSKKKLFLKKNLRNFLGCKYEFYR
jgi:hypothetical protein